MIQAATDLRISNRGPRQQGFGLIAVQAEFEAREDLASCVLQLRLSSHRAYLPGEGCLTKLAEGRWSLLFHINSHLVEDGSHALEVIVVNDGEVVFNFTKLELNLENSSDLGRAVAADLREYGTPIFVGSVIDSSQYPFGTGYAKAWFNTSEPPDVQLSLAPQPSAKDAQDHLRKWGFCILPERLPIDIITQFREELTCAIEAGQISYRSGSSDRIHGAHHLPAGRSIWQYPPVLSFLKSYFRDVPCACQTLTYINGSEQDAHQDTIHLTPYPDGFMAGVWIALEDVQPESGELFVYPGSHRTPRLLSRYLGLAKVTNNYASYARFSEKIRELLESGGYEKVVYRPKAGEILVWHENLIHGGSPRIWSDRTRFSIVSHYFAKGGVSFFDSRGEAAGLDILPDFES